MNASKMAVLAGAALIACTAASADTMLPNRKVGLWENTMSRDGKALPTGTTQMCFDAASEAKMNAMSEQMANKACQQHLIKHNMDGTWTVDSKCTFDGGVSAVGHTVVTGDFNSKYTMTTDTTTTGGSTPDENGKHQMVMTATLLGPCKAGMKGGDVIMSNGMKMNALEQQNSAPSSAPQH